MLLKILLLSEIEFASQYFRQICALNNWEVDYFGSQVPLDRLEKLYNIFILSDYPSGMLAKGIDQEIVSSVSKGSGLLMVGGWSSYSGLNGHYKDTDIGGILPVDCLEHDDRVNIWSGLLLKKLKNHPILQGLDWEVPPVICGYNQIIPKPYATIVIDAERGF